MLVSFIALEHLKIVGYVVSGYAVCRSWFHKEISAGKKVLVWVEARANSAETKVVSDIKKVI